MKPVYLIISVALLLCACSNTDRLLDDAEAAMFTSPGEAYKALAEMDTLTMSEPQKARRALLAAYLATVNNDNVDLTEADLVRATTAFDGQCNANEVKSLIIKSELAKNSSNPVARLELLKDAEFLASQISDKADLGFVYLYLANTYARGFNGLVSEYYAGKSAGIFSELGYMKESIDARMAIIGGIVVKRDYATMLDSMLSLKKDVIAYSTDSYKTYFLDQLARALDANGRSGEAIALWHSIYDDTDSVTSNTLAHWALAYLNANRSDSAELLINKAIALPHSHGDEYLCRNVQHDIWERLGRRSELAMIDSLREKAANADYGERKIADISLALNKKYESATRDAWRKKQEAESRVLVTIAIAVGLIFISVFAILYYRKQSRLLKIENENNLLKIRTVEHNLFERERSSSEVSEKVSALFKSRFAAIDKLASAYFECRETVQERNRICAEAKSVIEDFSSPSSIRELEEILNASDDSLMMRFREDFPKLPASQQRLALFIFCGLSLQSISIFQKAELRNIYVYKSRLKSTIAKSSSPRKEIYLSYF